MASSPRPSPAESTDRTEPRTLRAYTRDAYGGPEVLRLETIEIPELEPNQILVAIRGASINPMEWHMMTGLPVIARATQGLRKPKDRRLGADFSGVVQAVGSEVEAFRPGDEVFGESWGTYADHVVMNPRIVLPKPERTSFTEAASIGVAAFTALQGLRDRGEIEPGDEVLVNGASGGVGTFAVQMAKHFGATVTGVCSTRNVDLVRSIGADHVFDYQTEDVAGSGRQFDIILDTAGGWSWPQIKAMLKDDGTYVWVGSEVKRSLPLLWNMLRMAVKSRFGSRNYRGMLAKSNVDDLAIIAEMLESGAVTPVIDDTFSLDDLPEAMRRQGEGHARGKKVMVVGSEAREQT